MTSTPRPLFAVVGNPIAHSRSPAIHQAFATQCGIDLTYERIQAPLDAFADTVKEFFLKGGGGLNVTVPFKEEAYRLAQTHLSERAQLAGAVNTLWMHAGSLHGCNTDGVGLLADIRTLGHDPLDKRLLLVGAGGAARGVILPLLEAGCTHLRIVNRTESRARTLHSELAGKLDHYADRMSSGPLEAAGEHWDIVINATSGGLSGQAPALPQNLYAKGALAYDMVYGSQPTPFMRQAEALGAATISDGLGMLVEQAAASFEIWHGVLPDTRPVLTALRTALRSI